MSELHDAKRTIERFNELVEWFAKVGIELEDSPADEVEGGLFERGSLCINFDPKVYDYSLTFSTLKGLARYHEVFMEGYNWAIKTGAEKTLHREDGYEHVDRQG